ncbi:hypothetical protein H0H81_002371, partial [Sphagnurus paluster]
MIKTLFKLYSPLTCAQLRNQSGRHVYKVYAQLENSERRYPWKEITRMNLDNAAGTEAIKHTLIRAFLALGLMLSATIAELCNSCAGDILKDSGSNFLIVGRKIYGIYDMPRENPNPYLHMQQWFDLLADLLGRWLHPKEYIFGRVFSYGVINVAGGISPMSVAKLLYDHCTIAHVTQITAMHHMHSGGSKYVLPVNHVLNFMKLSRNAKAGGIKNVIVGSRLRQLSLAEGNPLDKVKVKLSVTDTGKGISQNFLKNQLFHPFLQENPLQMGTGLGLAIVNIVAFESVGGKVEVWSKEGQGTQIKVSFLAEPVLQEEETIAPEMPPFKTNDLQQPPSIFLVGFNKPHPGVRLLRCVLEQMLKWWGFQIHVRDGHGNIVIMNDNPTLVQEATERRDATWLFIILTAAHGSPVIMTIAGKHKRIGGEQYVVEGLPVETANDHALCNSTSDIDWLTLASTSEHRETPDPDTVTPTIAVGTSSSLLKSSVSMFDTAGRRFQILVVEDN